MTFQFQARYTHALLGDLDLSFAVVGNHVFPTAIATRGAPYKVSTTVNYEHWCIGGSYGVPVAIVEFLESEMLREIMLIELGAVMRQAQYLQTLLAARIE